ncbi:acylpyruvase FAHD1, mitochondrial-like [Mercenaria mercenaria]|uniref:acylpyruvase FAHD1, mitochondrial-like n=1 Tax=Mercenaria mercenaria TaxID=6596 RepID=UPI00234F5395|nr:acylpyruvase FAHD1, mitochondrial-like [Mercenaria mercenaria]
MATKLTQFREFGRKIVAVGRNYRAHAAELGNPVPQKPILFLKPTSSYITEGENIKIPVGCSSLHHEVELGIVIGKPGSAIPEQDAKSYIGGYILALDMTARDFQDEAKKKGQPWSLAKGFDTSCPVSGFIDKDKISNPESVRLWLKVNDATKQDGTTSDMIFSIPYLISYISRYFKLEEGDVILTGTPEGVGPVASGDVIEAGLGDVVKMKFKIEQRN